MKYLIEQYKWDTIDDKIYYHLLDSKEFISNKPIECKSYYKNGSYFTITTLDDEVQNEPRRTKQRSRKNV